MKNTAKQDDKTVEKMRLFGEYVGRFKTVAAILKDKNEKNDNICGFFFSFGEFDFSWMWY